MAFIVLILPLTYCGGSHPSLTGRRPHHQVVVDGAHAGSDLGEDMDRFPLGLRFNDAPEIDGAVLDGDADQRRFRPALVLEFSITFSRMAASSGCVRGALSLRLARPCSRFALLTMPTIFPFSTIGTA